MLKNDYILRMIEQMGDILRAAFEKRKSGRYEESHKELDRGYEFLGLSRKLIMSMPCEQVMWLLNRFGRVEEERYLALSRLMKADAQAFEDEGQYDTAYSMYQTSLQLLNVLSETEDISDPQEVAKETEEVRYMIQQISENHPKDHD